MTWISAMPLERLRRDGKVVAKLDGKQIALFAAGDTAFACNNRCPHEGYPQREGTLDNDCVLTCNWHGWKFDLRTGDNLLQGDRLRTYPTRIVDGAVWVDVTDPPSEQRRAQALANLRAAFDDHEYDRIARELARLRKANADPVEAVAAAVEWSHARLRFGTTHAYPAAVGWLALYDQTADGETRLVCLVEAIGHMAWDCLREPAYPFSQEVLPYDEPAFAAAIEAQDEDKAVALLRGALAAGHRFAELERGLTAAALRHYADFGHSLIYVVHTGRLIDRLDPGVETPLLLALVRSLVNASREDLIPEFRGYAKVLRAWPEATDASANGRPALGDFLDRSIDTTMTTVAQQARHAAADDLHRVLLEASALNLLRYDTRHQDRTDNSVADNIGWLDFTHAITFGNAVRLQCAKFPELWPQGLLQMACFVGRNSGFVDKGIAPADWRVRDRRSFERDCVRPHHGSRRARIHSLGASREDLSRCSGGGRCRPAGRDHGDVTGGSDLLLRRTLEAQARQAHRASGPRFRGAGRLRRSVTSILIFGGSCGLGAALSWGLPVRGDTVWLVSRGRPDLDDRDGVQRNWIEADLSVRGAGSTVATAVGDTSLDVVIYNAGIWEHMHSATPMTSCAWMTQKQSASSR